MRASTVCTLRWTALVVQLHGDPQSFPSSTRQCPRLTQTRSSMTVGSNHGGYATEQRTAGWPQWLPICPTSARLRTIHKQSACACSAPCACLHKRTYSSLRKKVSSTSEPTHVCVFLRVHACLNTCWGRRASIACALLLYDMLSVATLLHAYTRCLAVTILTKLLSLPSLPSPFLSISPVQPPLPPICKADARRGGIPSPPAQYSK